MTAEEKTVEEKKVKENTKGHMRKHGFKYISGLAAAAAVGGVLWWSPWSSKDNESDTTNNSSESPATVTENGNNNAMYGPVTLEIEKFVDADNNGQPDDPSQTVRFVATYTERPAGNELSIEIPDRRIVYSATDFDGNGIGLEELSTAYEDDTLDKISIDYSGGNFPFFRDELRPTTTRGRKGLEMFTELDKDYLGVRRLLRAIDEADFDTLTSGTKPGDYIIKKNDGDLTYRLVDKPEITPVKPLSENSSSTTDSTYRVVNPNE